MSKAEIFKKELEAKRIVTLRMVTGEEVITRVKSTTDTYIEIEQPRVLIAELRQKSDGQPFMAANVLNWLNSDPDATAKVSYDDVITVIAPEKSMENEYIRFTTGIALAETTNKKIIV